MFPAATPLPSCVLKRQVEGGYPLKTFSPTNALNDSHPIEPPRVLTIVQLPYTNAGIN